MGLLYLHSLYQAWSGVFHYKGYSGVEASTVQHNPRVKHSVLLSEFMDLVLHTFRV